jgi:hypothetical protein
MMGHPKEPGVLMESVGRGGWVMQVAGAASVHDMYACTGTLNHPAFCMACAMISTLEPSTDTTGP